MKTAITVLLGLASVAAAVVALSAADPVVAPSPDDLITELSWKAVGYEHMAMTLWPKPVGPTVEQLIKIGKPATRSLLAALSDPGRAVAAHLVLCTIWFPGELASSEEPLYRGSEVVGLRYHLRGLVWTVPASGEPVVDRGSVAEALDKWCHHVPKAFRSQSCRRAG